MAQLTAPFAASIRLNRKAARVTRQGSAVRVRTQDGSEEIYDKVIFACHADQALEILEDPTSEERRLLGEFKYQPNDMVLHTDPAVMPKTKRCWASWNYRMTAGPSGSILPSTHYWMNSLQDVSDRRNYFVSMNDHGTIAQEKMIRHIRYEHPIFSPGAVRAQRHLPALTRRPSAAVYFCGSYFKYGFHEDALTSALDLCRLILGDRIWA